MSGMGFDPGKVAQLRKREFRRVLNNHKLAAATLCYFFPQYELEEALDLPQGDLQLLLKAAYYQKTSDSLLSLSVAGASKKPKAYKKMMNQLKAQLKEIEKDI